MSTDQRLTRPETALGVTHEGPRVAMIIDNHPDLPTDSEVRQAHLAGRIPATCRWSSIWGQRPRSEPMDRGPCEALALGAIGGRKEQAVSSRNGWTH